MFVLLPGNRGVLINTPCESSGTISLLDWIEKSFGNIKLTAIVTGFHQDNLGGDEILLSKNIPVYGSDLTVRLIKEQGAGLKEVILNSISKEENKKYYNSYIALKLIPPDSIYQIKKGLNLKIGGELFELFYPGESHTKDNIVVYLRKRKILFGGCMIKGLEFDNPGYTGYANMNEWPKSVEKVMNKFKDAYIVIPGHGTPGGKDLLPHMIKVLNDWNNRTSKNNNL
jgi:metallo-beta-lactamase class B